MSGLDDIPFMQTQADKEEYLLFVDSSKRNTLVDKTASQYQIVFDVPFYNVYGIDVLDTSIPRTMYLVDNNNNTMAFNVDNEGWTRFQVETGDLNTTQLSELLSFGMVSNGKPIYVDNVSSPPEVRNQLKFYSNYPFSLNMTQSSLRGVLGFANPIIQTDSTQLGYYDLPVGYTEGDDDVFVASPDNGNVNYVTAFQGPTPVTNFLPITPNPTSQLFTVSQTGNAIQVNAQFAQIGVPTANNVQFSIVDGGTTGATMATGNLNVIVDTFKTPTMCLINDIQQYQPLIIDQAYYVSFTSTMTDTGNTWGLYYAQPSTPNYAMPGIFTGPIAPQQSPAPYTDYSQQLCCAVLQGGVQYKVIAPGLINLTGAPYLLIRCQEIEDHLYNSQAFTNNYNMGLTKVQMGIFGFGQNRYDFSNYTSRTFHPISRLQKMTLRFELPDGSLYDFKGVDHTLTFKLRYYASNQKAINKSILNPNYNPNRLEWLRSQADAQEKELRDNERQEILRKLRR